ARAAARDRARRRRGPFASALAGAHGRRRPRRDRGAAPRARTLRGMRNNKLLRILATLAVTGAAIAYIVSKIDLGKTAHIIGNADAGWLALTAALTFVTVPPQAWRWRLLLRARDVDEPLGWLTRAYFVSYAVGQVLPTAVGGDASRIYETTKRHPGF